jgi:hypothetical protein
MRPQMSAHSRSQMSPTVYLRSHRAPALITWLASPCELARLVSEDKG